MDTWNKPYNGRLTTKRFAFRKAGIYIIRDTVTKIITYIGMSKVCAYTAMYRHFEQWNDKRQYRVTYQERSQFEVRIIFIDALNVHQYERRLIKYFNPRDNAERYEDDNSLSNSFIEDYITEPQLENCPF